MDERLAMLKEIQELEFAAVELNLFLDTHPQDQAALRDYQAVSEKLLAARKRYEEMCGPLTATWPGAASHRQWLWIQEPWPWEIEYV